MHAEEIQPAPRTIFSCWPSFILNLNCWTDLQCLQLAGLYAAIRPAEGDSPLQGIKCLHALDSALRAKKLQEASLNLWVPHSILAPW